MSAAYDPAEHESLDAPPWDVSRACNARDTILAATLDAIAAGELWPPHPDDFDEDEDRIQPATSVYMGAAGTIAFLAAIAPRDVSLAALAARVRRAAQTSPNQSELGAGSYMVGSAGPALAAALYASDDDAADQLLTESRAMIENDGYEIFAGAPGFMIASQAMFASSGNEQWREVWLELFHALVAAWEEVAPQTFLWDHNIYGKLRRRYLGAAHGFAGTAGVLLAGLQFVSDGQAETIVGRIVRTACATAVRNSEGLANWPAVFDDVRHVLPVQWCHGAPGLITSLSAIPPGLDATFDDLLTAAGELIWHAGPLQKSASLCHGAAGNGFAFLRLYERTNDERWLTRARAFAMHAIVQSGREREAHGRPWHSLWTGDLGIALFVHACLSGTSSIPTIDGWPMPTD